MSTKLRESLEKAFEQHDANIEGSAESSQEVNSEPAEAQDSQTAEPAERESAAPDSKESRTATAVSGDESGEDIKKLSTDSSGQKPDEKSGKEPQVAPPSEVPQDVPPFWKAEDKAVWAKVPPEVRQIVRKYEDSRNKAVTQFKQIINEKIGQWSDASWDQVFPKERIRALQIEGKTPAAATASLWAWNDFLEEDAEGAVIELMQEYGLTPEQLHYRMQGAPQQAAQPPQDPRVDQLLAQQQQQLERQQVDTIKQQLNAFGEEKNAQGVPLRPHWNEVKAYIKQILPVVYSENPDINDYEALHSAYERAVYANPQVRTKLVTTNNQVKFSDEKTQRAKEAASASLTGSSSRSAEQPKTAKTARDALGMAWAEHSR